MVSLQNWAVLKPRLFEVRGLVRGKLWDWP